METSGIYTIDPYFIFSKKSLFEDLFYFDKIYYNFVDFELLESMCSYLPEGAHIFKERIKELEKLEKNGLIFKLKLVQPKQTQNDNYIKKLIEESLRVSKNSHKNKSVSEFMRDHNILSQLETRMKSVILNDKGYAYTPIINDNFVPYNFSKHTVSNIALNVLIKKFPIPSTKVQIQEFLDFKNDPDTKLKIARLRDWSTEISKKNYTEIEIEQKIEYLLMEYSAQLDLHKIKYETSAVETFVTLSTEILENLVRLKFSSLAKTIFDLKKQEINLLEAEQKMTGREVAYIHKANNTFK